MKRCLLLVVAGVCQGLRIPRISESYLPGFHHGGIYHGQGGNGFQHGQVDNHPIAPFSGAYEGQYGNLDLGNEFYGRQASIGDHANVIGHFAGVPFGDASANHLGPKSREAVPHNFGRFEHARDYDYQL